MKYLMVLVVMLSMSCAATDTGTIALSKDDADKMSALALKIQDIQLQRLEMINKYQMEESTANLELQRKTLQLRRKYKIADNQNYFLDTVNGKFVKQ